MTDSAGIHRIAVLGSTGSIGTNCLEVLGEMRDEISVAGLTAHRRWQDLQRQAEIFQPRRVVISDATLKDQIPRSSFSPKTELVFGAEGIEALAADAETDSLIRAPQARSQYSVDGTGFTIAVLDTGLRTTHVDFLGKVATQVNFTADNGGNINDATDGDGHGTNVAGIAMGNGIHVGIAPGARVVPIKVLGNNGSGSFTAVEQGLDWVIANRTTYNITVVNMSLGDSGNYQTDFDAAGDTIRQKIQTLTNARVAVVIAAGNSFFDWNSAQGMGYPGIIRESISVGAVYDANIGSVAYGGGATAFTTGPRRVTPFSQRLHSSVAIDTRTDIFAPGARLTAAGIGSDVGESQSDGTSQAAPVVSGLCLLMQQLAVPQLEGWLRVVTANTTMIDGDDEDDNVANTGLTFPLTDAVDILTKLNTDLTTTPVTPSKVTPTLSGSTLTLTGDKNASSLSITVRARKLMVQSAGGTKLLVPSPSGPKEVTSVQFTLPAGGVINVAGDLGAGADMLAITSVKINTINIKLGEGADKVVMNYCTVATSAIDGGSGTDSVVATTSKVTTNSNVSVP